MHHSLSSSLLPKHEPTSEMSWVVSACCPTTGAVWGDALLFSPDSVLNKLASCESIPRFSNNRKQRIACHRVQPRVGRGVAASNVPFEEL